VSVRGLGNGQEVSRRRLGGSAEEKYSQFKYNLGDHMKNIDFKDALFCDKDRVRRRLLVSIIFTIIFFLSGFIIFYRCLVIYAFNSFSSTSIFFYILGIILILCGLYFVLYSFSYPFSIFKNGYFVTPEEISINLLFSQIYRIYAKHSDESFILPILLSSQCIC